MPRSSRAAPNRARSWRICATRRTRHPQRSPLILPPSKPPNASPRPRARRWIEHAHSCWPRKPAHVERSSMSVTPSFAARSPAAWEIAACASASSCSPALEWRGAVIVPVQDVYLPTAGFK